MVTIRQIAQEAGVSVGTVSNVINNVDRVAPETRARVLEIMRRYNYRPNAIARSLSTHRTRTIGLVISNIGNPFFTDLAQGAIEAAQSRGCGLLVVGAAHDLPEQIQVLIHHWVDGLFIATQPFSTEVWAQLDFGETPLGIMDHGQPPPPNTIGLISFDWRQGALAATRHLIDLGHRRIGYVGGIPDRSSTLLREEGYRQALAEAGLEVNPDLIRPGDFLTASGYTGARDLLNLADPPTALLMANDLMALGAMQAIAEAGSRIPEDISLVGMDDTFFAAFLAPPLTTVHVPTRVAGRLGIEMLSESAEATMAARRIVLPTQLVTRQSTAPVSQDSSCCGGAGASSRSGSAITL